MLLHGQGAPAGAQTTTAPAAGPFGEGAVAAQFAISALLPLFPKSISKDGRLQAENLFAIAGALAGFAAQYAVRHDMAASGGIDAGAAVVTLTPGEPIDVAAHKGGVVIAQAPNGERYYFADAINALLVPERLDSMSAFSLLGGQAMRLGASRADLPDCLAIFDRTVASMGAPDFGAPCGPVGHKPGMAPRQAIEIFWPATLIAFTREPLVPVTGFKLLPPRLWPVALAMVAATYMDKVKASLAPAVALTIFMEAAIPMSKIDQSTLRFAQDSKH